MQFKRDVPVFSVTNERLGVIKYVVIDPRTKAVTHLVVAKAPVPDAVFEPDKVVPVEVVSRAGETRVELSDAAPDWDALQDFEQALYIPVKAEEDRALAPNYTREFYWYPFSAEKPAAPEHLVYPQTEIYADTREHIPAGTIALKEGARVISDDRQAIGNVDRVFVDPETGKVTHFSVRQDDAERIIPAWWVKQLQELEVTLSVEAHLVEKLGAERN